MLANWLAIYTNVFCRLMAPSQSAMPEIGERMPLAERQVPNNYQMQMNLFRKQKFEDWPREGFISSAFKEWLISITGNSLQRM